MFLAGCCFTRRREGDESFLSLISECCVSELAVSQARSKQAKRIQLKAVWCGGQQRRAHMLCGFGQTELTLSSNQEPLQ